MWNPAKWRTVIRSTSEGGAGAAADFDVAFARPGRVAAVIAVMGLAGAMAVLPALLAFGVGSEAIRQVAVGLGSLAAVWGGGKVAAATIGGLRFATSPRGRVSEASYD